MRTTLYRKVGLKMGLSMALPILLSIGEGAKSQVIISNNYTQDFNNLGSGLPNGWGTYTAISTNSLGVSTPFANTNPALAANTWSNTTGAFKNFASSTGLTQTSSIASQQASLDRALGIRPTGSFGDTATNYVSINFNFSTVGYQVSSLGLDAMVLATETRTKLWDIQYGIGISPTVWTTLATFSSSTNWITQPYLFTTINFGSSLDNQSSVWFRFSSTANSTGTGSRPSVAIDNFNLQVVPEPKTSSLILLASMLVVGFYVKTRKQKV